MKGGVIWTAKSDYEEIPTKSGLNNAAYYIDGM
jgi:hypothetical protein